MNFTAGERKIFCYFDGQAEITADPLELLKKISARAGNLTALVQKAGGNMAGADKMALRVALGAQEQLSHAVRAVFGFRDFDRLTGDGATDSQVFAAWDQFCDYLAEHKDAYRAASDDAAVYGILPAPWTYEAYVGLKLNQPRQRWYMALMVAQGVAAVLSGDDLPVAMMDPVASSNEEAEEQAYEANADRRFQRAKQEAKQGLMH